MTDDTLLTFPNPYPGSFPRTRMRRNRQNAWSRALIKETDLAPDHLIWPVFIREDSIEKDCQHLPNVIRHTPHELCEALKEAYQLGIRAIMLFPVVDASKRDETGSESLNETGLVCETIKLIKTHYPEVMVITDVALDPYTSHGQDGIVAEGQILNDQTLDALCEHALVQARAGTDIIAPSEMMDGRIGKLRDCLDHNGFHHVHLMSYAAKYTSAFYGPFRDAVKSGQFLGSADKKTYQMDPANTNEALREVALDLQEGADSIIIKPGLAYLDIIQRVKSTFQCPTIGFHVSGEYAMLRAAADAGFLKYDAALFETMLGFRRAGCNAIITYSALDMARLLVSQHNEKAQRYA